MMDIRTLYTLIAIADCGSFAEAGNRIGLSLSAVSMQVRALEEELEIAIFDRSRRPPVLTDAGLALVHRARDLIAHWESMSAALKKGTGAGLLKLGSVHTCASGVPLALRHLQKQGHGLEVHVTTGLTHDLERAVHHRQLDVAIVTEPEVPRSDLDFLPFVDEQLVVIAHRSVRARATRKCWSRRPMCASTAWRASATWCRRRSCGARSWCARPWRSTTWKAWWPWSPMAWAPRWCRRGVKNEFPATIRVIPLARRR